jgi:hypothetical protein
MDSLLVGEEKSMTFDLGKFAEIEVSIGSNNDLGHMQFSTLHPSSYVPSLFCGDRVCHHSFYNQLMSTT